MSEAGCGTNVMESLIAYFNSATITPYNSITQHLQVFVYQDQAMHLIGYAEGYDVLWIVLTGRVAFQDSLLHIVPPGQWTLLRPSWMFGNDCCFGFRVRGSRHRLLCLCINYRDF